MKLTLLPIDQITPTQETVELNRLSSIADNFDEHSFHNLEVVRNSRKFELIHGHHRAVFLYLFSQYTGNIPTVPVAFKRKTGVDFGLEFPSRIGKLSIDVCGNKVLCDDLEIDGREVYFHRSGERYTVITLPLKERVERMLKSYSYIN